MTQSVRSVRGAFCGLLFRVLLVCLRIEPRLIWTREELGVLAGYTDIAEAWVWMGMTNAKAMSWACASPSAGAVMLRLTFFLVASARNASISGASCKFARGGKEREALVWSHRACFIGVLLCMMQMYGEDGVPQLRRGGGGAQKGKRKRRRVGSG